MRNSRKIMAGLLILIMALSFISLIVLRVVFFTEDSAGEEMEISRGAFVEQEFSFQDFSGLNLSGGFELVLEQGPYSVKARYPELEDTSILEIEQDGDQLSVQQKKKGFAMDFPLELHISMPSCRSIESYGALEGELRDFRGEELKIESRGVLALELENCRYDFLLLDAEGGSSFHAPRSSFRDASLYVAGGGDIRIHMRGGELKGKLSGASFLQYSGEISSKSLVHSGAAYFEEVDADPSM